MSYHKVIIVGNLGRDPEMRYTPNDQAVTNFPVATNRVYTSSTGERIKETVWFRVSVWGRQAEACNQYLSTGRRVLVEGRMNPDRDSGGPRLWQTNDGQTRASYEITAERVIFLSSRTEDQEGDFQRGGPDEEIAEDDMPF